jgi:hypothetical protein
MKRLQQALLILLSLLVSLGTSAPGKAQAAQSAGAPSQSDSKDSKDPAKPKKTEAPPQNSTAKTDATTAAAKPAASQKAPPAANATTVWVNTATGVYHQPGSRWYGKTKQGKYMTEADAIKAGYRLEVKVRTR